MIPLDIAGNLLQNLNPMHAVVSTGTSARGLLVLLGLGMTITASGHQVFIGPSWEKDATPGYWFVVVIIMLLLFFSLFFHCLFVFYRSDVGDFRRVGYQSSCKVIIPCNTSCKFPFIEGAVVDYCCCRWLFIYFGKVVD